MKRQFVIRQSPIQATNNSWNSWPTDHTNNSWHRLEITEETNNISLSTPEPIIESSFNPGVINTKVNADIFNKCYSNGRGPRILIGMTISSTPTKQYLKDTAISFARSLATLQLKITITTHDNSESGTENDDTNDDIITTYTINPEESNLYQFSLSLLKCIPLTLQFVQENQSWNKI